MKTKEEIKAELCQFIGTQHHYKYVFGIKFTDGIRYLCDECECYWLIDVVASFQTDKSVAKESFQVYKLKVNPDKTAIIKVTDGDHHVLATQSLNFTDFPLDEIEIWCIDKVIILPSEY